MGGFCGDQLHVGFRLRETWVPISRLVTSLLDSTGKTNVFIRLIVEIPK